MVIATGSVVGSSKKNSTRAGALALAVMAASFGASVAAHADTYGNNGGTTLNLAGSWIDETAGNAPAANPPGAGDIAQFDSHSALTAATLFQLGGPTTWLGLVVQNPGGDITIDSGSNALTLGTSGIDMSAATQNVTISASSVTLGAAQSWNVATGRSLTLTTTLNTNGNVATFQGAGTSVISGTVTGTGGLQMSGTGVVTLSGGNSYSGGTTVNSGTVNYNTASSMGTGAITINGGTINNTSGTAVVSFNNSQLNINGNFTYGGSASLELFAPVTLGATPTITVNGTGANGLLTLDGTISGNFGLTKAGAGSLVLTAANSYSGATTINAGVLSFSSPQGLGTGTVLNFGGGTLQYAAGNNVDISTDTVTFTGNATIDTNSSPTVTFANSIGNGGAGGFTKTGIGTIVLAASDNYLGNTTVTGSANATAQSVLEFPTLASLGSGSAINIANGTLMYGPGNSADITQRTVNISGTLATIDLDGNSVTYANAFNGTATLTLANTGGAPVTVNLNAPFQVSGTLVASSGVTLVMGKVNTLQNASVTLNAGSSLNFGTFTTLLLGGLGGVQNVALVNANSQPVTLTLGSNNQGGNYTGVLSDGGSNVPIVKIGVGTQIFGGGNTFGGDVVVKGGTLEADFSPALVATQVFYQGLATPGNLQLDGGIFTTNSLTGVTTSQTFNSLIVNQGMSSVQENARTSNAHPAIFLGVLTRNIGGTVDFEGNTGTGGTQGDTTTGVFTSVANGPSGVLGGWATNGVDWAANTGANATNGQGHIYNLPAAGYSNSFANNTINTDMTANLTAPSAATTGTVRFNNTGNFVLTTTGANVIATGGILVTPNVGASTPAIVPAAGSTLTSGNSQDLIVIDNDTTPGGTLTIQTPIVNSTGPIGFTKSGEGTVVLSGNNTFTGGVYLNQGVLQVGNAGALNSATPNALFFGNSPTDSGTLALAGNSVTVSQLSTANALTGIPVIQNGGAAAAVLTVGGTAASTFNGTIQNGGSGSMGLTVSTTGGLTLSGSNTYSGNTTVTSGATLILSAANNNIFNSKVIQVNGGGTLAVGGITNGFTVQGGQTLTGSGTVTGSVGLGASAILSPGTAGVGTLTMDGLTLNANSQVTLDFGSGTNDEVVVNNSGGLVINGAAGSVNVNLLDALHGGAPFATAGTYDLFQFSGAIGGTGLSALLDANVPFGTQATFGTATVGANQFVTVTLAPSSTPVPTWNQAGDGSWNVAGNWTPTGVPNGQGQTAVLGSSITGPSTITLDGVQTVGTIAFNNSNSYTVAAGTGGSLVLDNGSAAAHLVGSSGNHTISAPVTLNSNLAASVTAGSVTLAGVVTDGGTGKSISMSGAGSLVLANANTYSGGTSLLSGTVQVGNNTSLGTGAVNFAASATLQAGANVTLANNISVAPSTTATIDTQANTMGLSGIVSSTDTTGTFNKIGTGTLVVTGVNTFTGTVAVNGGTLQLGNGTTNGSFANASITTVNSTLAADAVGNFTIANNITGSGGVAQNGTGVLTLSGVNSFTGGVAINSGTVFLGVSSNQTPVSNDSAGTGNIIMQNGTTLNLTGFGASTTPQYATDSNKIVVANGANVTVNNGPRGTFSGAVTGNGTLNFSVQYVRGAISGDWSVFSGQVNMTATTPNGTTTPAGDFRIQETTFNAPNAAFNIGANVNFYTNVSGGTVVLGDLTGSGTLASSDNNTATFSIGAIELAGQTSVFTGPIGNGATGARGTTIIKNGLGTLDLAGADAFFGSIIVNQGNLTFSGATAFPATNAGINVAAGATLDITGFNPNITATTSIASIGITGNGTIGSSSTTTPSVITMNEAVTSTFAGSIVNSINGGTQTVGLTVTTGTVILSGTNTYTGATTINGGALQLGAGGTTGSIVSTPTTTITDNGVLAINHSDNVAFGAIISGTGGVTQNGTGITTLTNAGNSFSGTVTVSNGTLQMVPGVQLGNGAVPLVANAGVFDLNGTSTTVGSFNGAAAGVIDNVSAGGAAKLTTGALSVDATFAGTIKNTSGTVALVKNGTANLTLSGGTSTYSGGTTLNSGAIFATNTTGSATGSGPVVLNGGTLGGTGFLGGTITAGSGPHTISPGANTANAIGTLTAGGLSTNANTTLAVDLVAPGGINDLLAITGNVSLAGGNITLGSNPLAGKASLGFYKIMTYTGTLSGTGLTVAATSTDPNVVYTLDTSTAGVINIHKGFIGDANDDGGVDLTDLSTVLNNFGSSTTSWSLGNFDGASTIDLTDLSDVLNNFGSSVATTAISTAPGVVATPEPASLAIVVPAAMALLRRRRSGSR